MPPKKRTDGKNKYRSGFCLNGYCEGTKPVSPSGAPMHTCDLWETCPCKCHALITEMCNMAGMERIMPEQSVEYLAYMREQRAGLVGPVEPESGDPSILLNAPDTYPLADTSDPVATPPRDATGGDSWSPHGEIGVRFTPTPSGRRARGQLEEDVREVCEEYSLDVYDWEHCTPKNVAERIAKKYAIEPPSTGAINAVWDRWEKLGFAKQDKKPSRFVCFEMDGSNRTLQMLKDRTKREKRSAQREARHGVRR